MTDRYAPPYHITPAILHRIEQIGEALGNLRVGPDSAVVTALRRSNRIKTVQASLAIEGNTLSLEQVTAILSGKRILAQPNEIKDESRLATDQESDQVMRLLRALRKSQRSASDLMAELRLSHRPTFRKNYLHLALEAGLIEMTQPGTPRAPNQKYRLTERGMELLKGSNEEEAAGI